MTTLAWDNNLLNLRDILADLYMEKSEARDLVQEAGLNPIYIKMSDKPINNWHSILNYARQDAATVFAIIDVAAGQQPPAKRELLLRAKVHELNIRGTDIGKDVHWQRPLDSDQLEKITGKQSTLLPIAFLERGLAHARAIAKITLGENGSGSGFLIGDDLLLTNHHVLEDKAQAQEARVIFNYQQTLQGLDANAVEYKLDPDSLFKTSGDDDWTVVRALPNEDGILPGAKWGTLTLAEQDPKPDEFTIIVQHPGGGPKQIALYHNVIAFVDEKKRIIQYLTDTEPGSSGAPVFDTHWNLIALHHSGGWLREPGKDPKQKFYRNEGIHVNTVLAGLTDAGVL
jgi:V8-like Glu-specific endopeptidase